MRYFLPYRFLHVLLTDEQAEPIPDRRGRTTGAYVSVRNINAVSRISSLIAHKGGSLNENSPLANIWSIYLRHASMEDKESVHAWNSDIDSILIFAALFSAVLTTLLVESYQSLQPDPQLELMRAILLQMQHGLGETAMVQDPIPAFELTGSAIRINVYWFSSLIISLSTALLAILAKQW
ncbi:hypothetical protein GY45DRAFT_1260209, partial [Cubamyces sp. BRFM 1775]